MRAWSGFICYGIRTNELGNELPGYIKGGKFLDQLSDRQFLNKDSVLWSYLVTPQAQCSKLSFTN